jgi:microcompartment protein CcmK/EutM
MLNSDRLRRPSKFLVYMLVLMHALTGCVNTATTKSSSTTGPQVSSSYEKQVAPVAYQGPKLDIVIPAFSPGLSEDATNYEEDGVWPELRRAEANRFAYKLKKALDDTGKFGAVRVTPNSTASGDLYVLGEIVESNGLELEFNLEVVDVSGKRWMNDAVEYEVSEGFYKNPRNEGKDAYDPAFKAAADDIVETLLKQKGDLNELKQIADLRFGASFNEQAFSPYLDTSSTPMTVLAMPSDADPLFQRVQSVRVREQLFIDNLQQDYSGFSQQMEDSYLVWQKASFTEVQLQKEAKTKSWLKIAGGVLLVAAAVAAAASGSPYDNNIGTDVAAIAAGVGGAVLISSGLTSREEAQMHTDAINELGQSVDLEMSPQVIQFEKETKELTGDVDEQFQQWRSFMAQMYELEATPETQI